MKCQPTAEPLQMHEVDERLSLSCACCCRHAPKMRSALARAQLIGSNKATSASPGAVPPLGGILGRKMLRSAPAGKSFFGANTSVPEREAVIMRHGR